MLEEWQATFITFPIIRTSMHEFGTTTRQRLYTIARIVGLASVIALITYYVPDYFLYEKFTAEHSAFLMSLVGMKGTVWMQGHQVFLNEFEIQRMCTGVQVIAVFLGLIVAMPNVTIKKRVFALSVVAVSVYLANLGRIVFEIWLLYNGVLPWSLAHYPTGLILGVFSVALLIIAADHFMPEIGDLAFSALDGLRRPT
jgi:exosortase/archaeosortase family protein